ncbi:MAG: trigger factor [Phycisphaerae bacterium]
MADQKAYEHNPEHKHDEEKPEDTLPPSTSTLEEAGAARKRIKLEIPAERITGKMEEAMKELQKDAVLPGFRRGRAPKRLIEKRFGTDMKNTLKGQLVAEAYQKAVEDHKLKPLGEPEVDMAKIELPETGPLTASLEVEITPEFELPNIEKIAVKKPILEANDARIDLAVENLRKHFGNWTKVNGPAAADDTVLADVKVQDPDNNVLTEQSAVQVAVKAGSIAGIQFDDLAEKLTGAAAGAVITLQGQVPADSRQENLRGKTLTITLTVKDVNRLNLPEVNQDFVTMLGFDDIAGLRKDLQERLVVQLKQETKNAMAQQIYRYLIGHTTLDLPPQLSQRQMANVFRRRALQMMQQGVPENDIVQHIDQLRIASAQQATVDLKLLFIVGKLAEQFGIEVSEAELNGRIAEIAEQYGRRPEKVRHEFQQQGQLEQLFLQVRDGKVVDKLLETAEITEVDEKTLAEEFKNLPPMEGIGPNVQGISSTAQPKA